MENASVTATPDDIIDIASIRILDLRMLQQDEIRGLAHICGDAPARLQDLVDVMVDKSIFNESAGSRRQTYDMDRLPRNKERHFLSNLSSARLQSAVEVAGRSHKDLLIHLCRLLKISKKGDRALCQPQAVQTSGMVVERNRSMSLKRMATASACLAGRAVEGPVLPPSKAAAEAFVKGKDLAMEVLHQPSKRMKTKQEARRPTRPASQTQKQTLRAVKVTWLDHAESVQTTSFHGMAKIGHDFKSHDAERMGMIGHLVEVSKSANIRRGKGRKRKKVVVNKNALRCSCGNTYATPFTLRRHATTNGHSFKLENTSIVAHQQKIKKVKAKDSNTGLRCSCGNTYATPFTLRRHATTNGHSFKLTSTVQEITSIFAHQQKINKDEAKDNNMGFKPERQMQGTLLPERPCKTKSRHLKCRQCLRQFVKKKHYMHHLETHYHRKKKKIVKIVHKVARTLVSEPSIKVKVKARLGRPPKLKKDVNVTHEVGRKRKHEPASIGKRARAHKTSVYAPSGKRQSFTCQECGKIFDEGSRYTGHLCMHAKSRKMLVNETRSPESAVLRKSVMNPKDLLAVGFRALLNEKSGTYLSGLPAKLLFSGALSKKENGKI